MLYLSEAAGAAYTGIPRDRLAYHCPRWNFKPDAHYEDAKGIHPLYKREKLDDVRAYWENYQAERVARRAAKAQNAQSPVSGNRDGAT